MLRLRKYGHWYFLAALALAAVITWQAVFRVEVHRGRVFLHVFDVGQGDAILIESPNGNQVLVDGGPDDTVVARLGEVMPFWDRAIDLVVLTHPHADHLDGLLEVLERYDIGMVLESGVNHTLPEYARWKTTIEERRIPRVVAGRGQEVHLGGGAALRILTPFRSFVGTTVRDIHDAAIVAKLTFASSTAFLMADAELPLERTLIAAGDDLHAEVLKVGHHGSKTSTSGALIAAVRPRIAIISAGRRNRYGHPTQEVLDRLAAIGIQTYRTDIHGTVRLVSDGQRFRLAP